MIRHISFDVWRTLIQPNPTFASTRSDFVADRFGLDREETKTIYKRVKDGYDKLAEETGHAYDSQGVYCGLLDALGVPHTDWRVVMAATERLFLEHPPVILDSTVETLRRLRGRYTMSIGSNTNFASGRVLGQVLEERIGTSGEPFFTYKVFSDLDGYSKPHPEFFKIIAEKASTMSFGQVQPNNILHVGDNRVCDGAAEQAGMRYHFVKSPEDIPGLIDALAA